MTGKKREEGVIANGLSLPSEEDSDLHLLAGESMRLATSPAKGTATEMRSGRRSSHIKAKSLTSTPQEKDDAVVTMWVDTKTGCPLHTVSFTLANS